MEVQIKNLGPVKDAQITLKPLTIFVGPNNSGKTYIAYLLYGILKNKSHLFRTLNRRKKKLVDVSEDLISRGFKDGKVILNFNLIEVIHKNKAYLENVSHEIERQHEAPKEFISSFWKFMGSDTKDQFKNLDVKITLKSLKPLEVDINTIRRISFDYLQVIRFKDKYALAKVIKKPNSENIHIVISPRYHLNILGNTLKKNDKLNPMEFQEEINIIVNRVLLGAVFRVLFPLFSLRPVVFPAQRNTLTLDSIYSAINIAAREELVFEKHNILVTYSPEKLIRSRPIIDFLNLMDTISGRGPIKGPLYELGEKLENVLGGQVLFETKTGKLSIRFLGDDYSLNLQTASSMVQQLSSLVLYLKYFAKPGDVVVIDEPESNLHPEAQMKIAEILAELVNRGVWVIITTHSPYVIDHLNNLIAAGILHKKYGDKFIEEISKEQRRVPIDESAFLDPNKVSAYLVNRGAVSSIITDEYIDWETFSNVSDLLSNIYSKILEVSLILEGNPK